MFERLRSEPGGANKETPEEVLKRPTLLRGETLQLLCSVAGTKRNRSIDGPLSLARQGDEDAAAVVRVRLSLYETTLFQSVDSVGHGATRNERVLADCADGLPEWRSAPTENRKDVELRNRQSARSQRGLKPPAVHLRDEEDAREDSDGARIQVWSFPLPLRQKRIDSVVLQGRVLRSGSTARQVTVPAFIFT
jgi:hypothetical protein